MNPSLGQTHFLLLWTYTNASPKPQPFDFISQAITKLELLLTPPWQCTRTPPFSKPASMNAIPSSKNSLRLCDSSSITWIHLLSTPELFYPSTQRWLKVCFSNKVKTDFILYASKFWYCSAEFMLPRYKAEWYAGQPSIIKSACQASVFIFFNNIDKF
jgi:hypothetical protein